VPPQGHAHAWWGLHRLRTLAAAQHVAACAAQAAATHRSPACLLSLVDDWVGVYELRHLQGNVQGLSPDETVCATNCISTPPPGGTDDQSLCRTPIMADPEARQHSRRLSLRCTLALLCAMSRIRHMLGVIKLSVPHLLLMVRVRLAIVCHLFPISCSPQRTTPPPSLHCSYRGHCACLIVIYPALPRQFIIMPSAGHGHRSHRPSGASVSKP
jgi:hypothetical protein